MIYSTTPINSNGLVKEGVQQLYDNHACHMHPQNGDQPQNVHANKSNAKVYCDACIIQFYHRSNTFLSNLDMSCKQHQNKSSSALSVRCSETINNFNNSLIQMERDIQNFAVDCQSNCIERNLHITVQQEMDLQRNTLYNINNLQSNNFSGNTQSLEIGFYPNLIQYSNSGVNNSNQSNHPNQSHQLRQHAQYNNNQILGLHQKSFNNSQNQLNLARRQSSSLLQQQLNQTGLNNFNQIYVQGYQQINPLQQEYNTLHVLPSIHSPTLASNQINYSEQINQNSHKINNSIYPFQTGLSNPQSNFYNIIYTSEIQNNFDQQPLKQENLSNQIDLQTDSNSSLSMPNYLPDSMEQYQQNPNIHDNNFLIQNQIENQQIHQLQQQITENYRNDQSYQFSDPKSMKVLAEEKINGDLEIKNVVSRVSAMKKANQKIKHAPKQQKQFDIIIRDHKNSIEQVNIHYVDNNFIQGCQDQEEMKIIFDHECQQEFYSKKRKNNSKKMQDDTTVIVRSRRQQIAQAKCNQQVVQTKHKEIEKKKFDRYKKQQEFLLSSGWCPQSQQLLFEWNNTPLKQIQLQSDKIVNEFVNVASYVNILGKNRIMIISQNTHSLKYQINLIDLQENRVICKNQLGQNFQLYPFEPSKLNVQTVKINERISCIYLMGGSYFKIIKNSTLKNVKRVKQYCIQQILPINKGRKLVALSLNGLINIYSTTNDRFHLVQSMKIKRESPFGISYVNYFDVDSENSLIYCCVLSSRSQFIQIFNMFTGEIIYSQDIHILQQNYGYNITNMKIFQNHLYIELQFQQDGNHQDHPVQYKVQAYKIDNQSHHLNEFKTYAHSNILKSTISSKQFFLYNSQKSCIIGFEKLNSKKYKHYLSSPDQLSIQDKKEVNSLTLPNIEYPYSQQQNQPNTAFGEYQMCQKVFKLNIKQTSPKYRPIFTHIFKDIPHDHQQNVKKNVSHSLFNTFPGFNACSNSKNNTSSMPNQDMVLTLFDQNKNVYKIFQDS